MHIFIDESGTFAASSAPSSVSVVGALVIPDERLADVERRYRALRPQLPKDRGEVKGRLLSEAQVDRVALLLKRSEALFEITAVDLGMHTEAEIIAHRADQVQRIAANITDKHSPGVRKGVEDLRAQLERMPPQLYVQSVVTFNLIARALDHATLYYSQRRPRELGAFHWIIDGKQRSKIIDWEQWWSFMIKPWLQSKSIREPMPMFTEGDYSSFKRFDAETPEYLTKLDGVNVPPVTTDIGKVMTESFRFSADPEPGLEMVDILTNATRRALIGNLKDEGWCTIPRMMIHTGDPYIHFVSLNKTTIARVPYASVVRRFSQCGRTMLAPRFRD